MRVTSSMNRKVIVNDMNRNLAALQAARAKISSGRQLNKPSDDPLNVVDALRLRAQLRANEMHERAATDALGRLDAADNTMNIITLRATRVRDLMLTAANAATDPGGRAAIASEIEGIRADMLSMANTVVQGSALFGGTNGTGQAFDPVTGNYLGTANSEIRRIGDGDTIEVAIPGTRVFGPNGSNLFQLLDQAANAVRTNSGIGAALSAFDASFEDVRLAHAETGGRARRAEDTIERLQDRALGLRSILSQVEDADLAEASIEFTSAQSAYEASLAAASKTLQNSLIDYLR